MLFLLYKNNIDFIDLPIESVRYFTSSWMFLDTDENHRDGYDTNYELS